MSKPERSHGAFVYTGYGKTAQVCPKEAVALKWCLAKRGHVEAYCKAFRHQWEECCSKEAAVTAAAAAAAAAAGNASAKEATKVDQKR